MPTREEIDWTSCVANPHTRVDKGMVASSGTSPHTNNAIISIKKPSTSKHCLRRFLLGFWIFLSIIGPIALVICATKSDKNESGKKEDKLQALRTNMEEFYDSCKELDRGIKEIDHNLEKLDHSLNRGRDAVENVIEEGIQGINHILNP